MAVIKLATAKRKNGDELHLKTSMQQVVGLGAALDAKQNILTQDQIDALEDIETIGVDIADIKAKIPAQATSDNQLADKEFVNSSLNSGAAFFVAYDAGNSNFPTKADLLSSTVWYNAGEEYLPKKNDYMIVSADESEGGAQTRYLVVADFTDGTAPTTEIQLQYIISSAPFTAAQEAALNSGITAEKVVKIDNAVSADDVAATYAPKTAIEALGTVHIVSYGTDLSGFKDNDLIIELDL